MNTQQTPQIPGVALGNVRVQRATANHGCDPPFDFLLHLQRQLGTGADATLHLLGEWLEEWFESYEAEPRAIRVHAANR
jgi:hypothetical protein